jgi:heme O synthase-like polyprenyltransferase
MNTALKILADQIDPTTVNVISRSVEFILKNGLNIIYFLLGSIAVVMIIVAGFTMSTSGGDAEAVKKAKNTILYSVIGLIIVLLATVITQFVVSNFKV